MDGEMQTGGERVIRSAMRSMDRNAYGSLLDESRRLEGHLVEMGPGKNRINGRIYILVRGVTNGNNGEVPGCESSTSARTGLLCR